MLDSQVSQLWVVFFQWQPPPDFTGRAVFRAVMQHPGQGTWSQALPMTVGVVNTTTSTQTTSTTSSTTTAAATTTATTSQARTSSRSTAVSTQLLSVTSERAVSVKNESLIPHEDITKEGYWFLPNHTSGNSLGTREDIDGKNKVSFTPQEEITKEGSWFIPNTSLNSTLEESEDGKVKNVVNMTPKEEITNEGPWFLPNKPLDHTREESKDAESKEEQNLEEREVESEEPYLGLKAEYGGWSPPENNRGAKAALSLWCSMLLL